MPYLGDYLGQLLAEITLARLHSDLETVRLAELYAAHPILRTMPVPHMRLPDVELEVPVLIEASEEPRAGESARGGVSLAEMRVTFDRVLNTQLSNAGIELAPPERRKLNAALDKRLASQSVPIETAIDTGAVADDLSAIAARAIAGRRQRAEREDASSATAFAAALNEAVRLQFVQLRTPPPRLVALVTTAEIRAAGAPEGLTRLRLKVSEQSYEWTTIESEGVLRDRLVPE